MHSEALVSQQRVVNAHLEDKLRGLSESSCDEITIHFIEGERQYNLATC